MQIIKGTLTYQIICKSGSVALGKGMNTGIFAKPEDAAMLCRSMFECALPTIQKLSKDPFTAIYVDSEDEPILCARVLSAHHQFRRKYPEWALWRKAMRIDVNLVNVQEENLPYLRKALNSHCHRIMAQYDVYIAVNVYIHEGKM